MKVFFFLFFYIMTTELNEESFMLKKGIVMLFGMCFVLTTHFTSVSASTNSYETTQATSLYRTVD